jgi:hypothetical protein
MASLFDTTVLAGVALSIHGSATVTGTSAYTPPAGYYVAAIVVVTPAVFTALAGTHTGFAGVTYPEAFTITGRFTGLTLASGTVNVIFGRNT